MSQNPPSRPGPGPDDQRQPWMGAPGYQPPMDHLPPHSPMPGAPPYPAMPAHPPAPVGQRRGGTSFWPVLGAAGVAVVLGLLVEALLIGAFSSPESAGRSTFGMITMAVVVALVVWAIIRQRRYAFWQLLLIVVPAYAVVRGLLVLAVLGA
jgi:hypothetical protein